MKVYQRLAESFKAEGVSAVFGIMGDANMYWYSGAWTSSASSYWKFAMKARVSAWPTAGRGPRTRAGRRERDVRSGTTQLATAFVVAARAESPLVAFCGEHPTVDDGYNQRFDNRGFANACETGFVRLNSPESADDVVRKAFYLARLESRLIMFSAPMDIQQKSFDDDEPYQPSSTILPKRAGSRRGFPQARDRCHRRSEKTCHRCRARRPLVRRGRCHPQACGSAPARSSRLR